MNDERREQMLNLPKWAQEHIRILGMERDTALESLNEWIDNQTQTPISIEDNLCLGESSWPSRKIRFIHGHTVLFKWAGVELRVTVPIYDEKDKQIRLSWESENGLMREVAFIPYSYQAARLVTKENMR